MVTYIGRLDFGLYGNDSTVGLRRGCIDLV